MKAQKFYTLLHDCIATSKGAAYTYFGDTRGWPELYGMVARIAKFLGARRQEKIILFANKSFEAYAAVFGTLLTNNVWVPVNSSVPAERLEAIMQMTGASLVLSDDEVPEALKDVISAHGAQLSLLSQVLETETAETVELSAFEGDEIAYIMFTSGSTGAPKGVPMTHDNYINFVVNCLDILDFEEGDVFSDYHDWAFDISIFYMFCWPLARGVIAPVIAAGDRMLPLRFIRENKVTIWSSVPSVIGRIKKRYKEAELETPMRTLFLCGEPFTLPVLAYCQNQLKVPNIYNFYGLTETGVENFHHHCQDGDVEKFEPQGHVPIGKPLPGNPADIAEDGELLLSGCQLTPGYLNGVGVDRFFERDGERWFKTGDIVEIDNGYWFCKGRKDSQVKLRGYRVELMDVEVNIKRHCGVDEAVCYVTERQDRQILVAVAKEKEACVSNLAEARKALTDKLPAYMIPDAWLLVEDLPVNANGKIDRKKVAETGTKNLA